MPHLNSQRFPNPTDHQNLYEESLPAPKPCFSITQGKPGLGTLLQASPGDSHAGKGGGSSGSWEVRGSGEANKAEGELQSPQPLVHR